MSSTEEVEEVYSIEKGFTYRVSLCEGGTYDAKTKDAAVMIGYLSRIQHLLETKAGP